MSKKERLEDLGEIKHRLQILFDSPVFEYTNSKHDYELWLKSYGLPESENAELYELHVQIRHLKDELHEIYYLACGDQYD